MTLKEIKTLIDESVRRLFENDRDLFFERAENSVACRLASYIQDAINHSENIKRYIVDAHYSRHINNRKMLDGNKIEVDVAIHKRRDDKDNLLVIEIETNNRPICDDEWKIKEMTKKEGEYQYKWGLFVVFGIGENAGKIHKQDWYIDGTRIST